MKKLLLTAITLAALWGNAFAADTLGGSDGPNYKAVPDWAKLPDGRRQLGNMHGDIAVSSQGEIYVSMMDPEAGLLVFAPNGHFLHKVPGAPDDFHGFIIHQEKDGEFIYGSRLNVPSVLKMTLDGKVVLNIPGSEVPLR